MSDMFDFGFTAVTEDELEVSKQAMNSAVDAESSQTRLDDLYNAIIPLLNNLKKNPEKEYILTTDRISKFQSFETHLTKI